MYLDTKEHPVTDLGTFDGKQVLSTSVAVTNAGDGLSQAMKIDPQLLHLGQKHVLVMECEVAKVRFDPIKDTDAVQRVHVLRAGTATLIDHSVVEDVLAVQREKIERAKEAEAGIARLPSDHELRAEHILGGHADGLVDDCPLCMEEVDALRAEAEGDA